MIRGIIGERMDVSQALRVILGVLLLVMSLGYATEDTSQHYENVTMTVSVSNQAPYVSDVTLEEWDSSASDQIDLSAATTKKVWCNATINDESGYGDIDTSTLNVTIWHNTNNSGSNDNNNHYENGSASESADACDWTEGINSTSSEIACAFDVQYYADSGTWTCTVNIKDSTGPVGTNETDTATVNTFLGIHVYNDTLDFGTVQLGQNSTTPLYTTVQNTCNQVIDLKIWEANWSGNLTCDGSGSKNISTQNYLSYNFTEQDPSLETSSHLQPSGSAPQDEVGLNWVQSDGTNSTNNTYWKLMVPRVGVSGTCVGIIQYQAMAT